MFRVTIFFVCFFVAWFLSEKNVTRIAGAVYSSDVSESFNCKSQQDSGPSAGNAAAEIGTTFGYNFGQSFVWLAQPRFNVLLETVFNRSQQVIGSKSTAWTSDLLLSPGIRWAYNFRNGLQIVPGVAVPVGVGPSSGEKGV